MFWKYRTGFSSTRKDELAPGLLHKICEKHFKIHSIESIGKSQTPAQKVFLNETLFEQVLFHFETV